MAKSEQQLRKEIRDIDTVIEGYAKTIQAFGSTPNAQEVAVIKGLRAKVQELAVQRSVLEKQVQALTTTTPLSNPTADPYKAQTQEALRIQLADIDKRLAELKKRQITITSPPFQNKYPQEEVNLKKQINEANEQRKLVLESINRLNKSQPYVAPPGVTYNPESPTPPPQTNQGLKQETRAQQTTRENFNVEINNDWRVRLYLAPESNYLYNDEDNTLLSPLKETNGVIFPYTPQIQVTHTAKYDEQDVTHSNYKLYFYRNSTVEGIQIMGEFTAQDTTEANYLLAVIHFFKSVTKMFYGKDENPVNGSPPPICYLDGFGTYQFNKHPLLITNFSYTLPIDVDYIRATINPTIPSGLPNTTQQNQRKNTNGSSVSEGRLRSSDIRPGGTPPNPQWIKQENRVPTYVPTKMQITINAIPVISRRDISNNFSLQAYANGSLLLGKSNKNIGAGIW